MTKDELLKLIKQYGKFWYISDHFSTGYPHGDDLLWFDEEDASNIDQYQDLVEHCVEHPDCIEIDKDNKRLFLLNRRYDIDLPSVSVLRPSKKHENCLVNFDEDYFK